LDARRAACSAPLRVASGAAASRSAPARPRTYASTPDACAHGADDAAGGGDADPARPPASASRSKEPNAPARGRAARTPLLITTHDDDDDAPPTTTPLPLPPPLLPPPPVA
jgi:hypothetical protein